MNRLFSYIIAALAFASVSCSGTIDSEDEHQNVPVDSALNVPEGVLRIFADKSEIVADGQEKVTFKVMFGKEDVSNAKTLQIKRSYEGGKVKHMAYGVNSFSTSTAGTYTFTAEYYYAGKKQTDNEVKVVATEYFTGEQKSYAQKVLAVCFTSTSCTSCPLAYNGMKALQESNPGVISAVYFHKDLQFPDPMQIDEVEEFRGVLGGFTGLPWMCWNMKPDTANGGSVFTSEFETEVESYIPTCGVAVSTRYDAASSKLAVNVGITSNLPAVHRYIIFLVEDGIDDYDDKVYDNVVRDVLTPATGARLNDNLPLTVGVEVKAEVEAQLAPDWDVANMRVVVAALRSEDGGNTYVVNNINECRAGGNSPYIYNE